MLANFPCLLFLEQKYGPTVQCITLNGMECGKNFSESTFPFRWDLCFGVQTLREKKHHERTWNFTNGGLVRCAGSSSFVPDFHSFPWEHVINLDVFNLCNHMWNIYIYAFLPKRTCKETTNPGSVLFVRSRYYMDVSEKSGTPPPPPPNHPF